MTGTATLPCPFATPLFKPSMADSPSLDARLGPDIRTGPDAARPATDASADLRRALEALYHSHFGKVTGYFRRSGQPEAVAAELAQDTFIQALRGLNQFKGQSKLSTWLWSIARNVLLAHLRSNPEGPPPDADPVEPDSLSNGVDLRLMDTCECVRRGFEAFSKAHPERAQVVYLAAVEGWTRAELAEFLGRTEHAATEYLSQCKARLRPFIEPCHGR